MVFSGLVILKAFMKCLYVCSRIFRIMVRGLLGLWWMSMMAVLLLLTFL